MVRQRGPHRSLEPTSVDGFTMTDHRGSEELVRQAGHDDGDPRRIEIVLPRARSIVWLGLKVCLLVIVGVPLLWVTAALLVIALVAATR